MPGPLRCQAWGSNGSWCHIPSAIRRPVKTAPRRSARCDHVDAAGIRGDGRGELSSRTATTSGARRKLPLAPSRNPGCYWVSPRMFFTPRSPSCRAREVVPTAGTVSGSRRADAWPPVEVQSLPGSLAVMIGALPSATIRARRRFPPPARSSRSARAAVDCRRVRVLPAPERRDTTYRRPPRLRRAKVVAVGRDLIGVPVLVPCSSSRTAPVPESARRSPCCRQPPQEPAGLSAPWDGTARRDRAHDGNLSLATALAMTRMRAMVRGTLAEPS